MKKTFAYKIQFSILFIFALLMTIIILFFISSKRSFIIDSSRAHFTNANLTFNKIISSEENLLKNAIIILSKNEAYKEIFRKKDLEKFYKEIYPLFLKLKELNRITHFYVHNSDGTNFIRIHKKEQRGDKINRITFKKSVQSNSFGSGIELGKTAYALRVVHPYYFNNDLIGYLELGMEIDHVFSIVQEMTGVEISILLQRSQLNEADWNGIGVPVGNYMLTETSSNKTFIRNFINSLQIDQLKLNEIPIVSHNNKYYSVTLLPFHDVSKKSNGYLLMYKNVNSLMRKSYKDVLFTVIIILLSAIITFIFIFLVLRKFIFKPLNSFMRIMQKSIIGDLTQRYELANVNCDGIAHSGKNECQKYDSDKVICFLEAGDYAKEFGNQVTCPALLKGEVKGCLKCDVFNRVIKDEFSWMGAWFNKLQATLSGIIDEIRFKAGHIIEKVNILNVSFEKIINNIDGFNSVTEKIKNSAENQLSQVEGVTGTVTKINENINFVSQNIHSQSSSIEQFSSTVEEMMANIRSIAGTSDKADKISQNLSAVAENGTIDIQKVIEGVNSIQDSSNQIVSILSVITGLAEQTNLLAMNAAIEAAHAGEFGKGFAVVADEIRKLAENSSTSSKEIQKLIKIIIVKIKNASELGKSAEISLNNIMADVKESHIINSEIYGSTKEQSTGANQILSAINVILSITQNLKDAFDDIQNESAKIKDNTFSLKSMSSDISVISKDQNKQSVELLNSIQKEKNLLNQIFQISNDFQTLINIFQTDNTKNNSVQSKVNLFQE